MPMVGGMRHLFTPCMFIGIGAVAVWVNLRFPRLQPRSLRGAVVHCAFALAIFHGVPFAAYETRLLLPTTLAIVVGETVLVMPALCYVLLSWLWLLARVRDQIGSSPKGGHPVRASMR
jgi:hypothetical protein